MVVSAGLPSLTSEINQGSNSWGWGEKGRDYLRSLVSGTIFILNYLSYIPPRPDSEDLDLQATQCFLENQGLEGEGFCVT